MNNLVELLHPGRIERAPLTGELMADRLRARAQEVALHAAHRQDPDVSVVIRSRNNVQQLEELFHDFGKQAFDGEVEVVVVDTESRDGTKQLAKRMGATLVHITQEEFNYPKALNRGFVVASNPWVFSFVDHSALATNQVFRTATRWGHQTNVAGAWGMTLPNRNASRTELLGSAVLQRRWLKRKAHVTTDTGMGFMATNCALINRAAWQEVGGFDESYGAGGEDGAFGKALLAAGYEVAYEPALAVHHTHGLSLVNSIRQFRNWSQMGAPRDFEMAQLDYRTDI